MRQPLRQKPERHWWPRRGAEALLVVVLAATLPAFAQQIFPTPDAAVDALVDGLARHDDTRVRAVLGPDYRRLLPLDALSEQDRTDFLAAWSKGHRIELSGATAKLVLSDGWTLPIPAVRRGEGWAFDTGAGQREVRTRRIGRNELAAMKSVYAYYDAQREYAEQFRNGAGVLEYARRFVSSPGKRDGLYWPTGYGESPSPAGPLFDTRDIKDGYFGYRFKILEAQGPSASGGARSYLSRGHLANGFALVAWPARYGESGVMTFLINHDGVAYEKNLGIDTAAIASAMTRFDPNPTWVALPPP
jgi:hypothetical protein